MSECANVRHLLALRPADWSAAEQRQIQEHLASCATCSALAQYYAEQDRLLQAGSRGSLTPAQRFRLWGRLYQEREQQRRRARLSVALGVTGGLVVLAALIVGGSLLLRGPQASGVVAPVAPTPGESAALPTLEAAPTPLAAPTAPPTPTLASAPPRTLTICLGAEPDTLYLHGGAMYVAQVILEAVYDGPIDALGYAYQPVILEKLPSLADGDAIVTAVAVRAGDTVVDSAGNVVQLTEGMSIRPAGCRSVECEVVFGGSPVEMDRMQATFRLKQGITWSDGHPLTAYDSVYSFNLAQDPATPAPYSYADCPTESYVALDPLTTVWTGRPGALCDEYFLAFWTPLPEHQWGEYRAVELIDLDQVARTPLGYGPYVIDRWVPGRYVHARRNERYFRAAEGLPYFDEVIFRFFGQFPTAGIDTLLEGQCDVLTMDILLDSESERLLELDAAGRIRLYATTETAWEHFSFGINPAEAYAATRPALFEDVHMRRAVALCLDRQGVVDRLLHGLSIVPHTYVPPEHPLYDPGTQQYPYDPAQGMELLEDLGWTDEDGDGIRECHGCGVAAEGTPLAFTCTGTTAPLRVQAMRIYQANLRTCGFDVTLENLPAADAFADGPDGKIFGRRFDLALFSWVARSQPGCEAYLCSQIPSETTGWAGQNVAGYCSAEFDALCGAALAALPGMPEYERLHREALQLYADDLPEIPLYVRLRLSAARPDLAGLIVDPTEYIETWNIEEFALKP